MTQQHLDGRMSARVQNLWPGALMMREVDDRGQETWVLLRGGQRLGLGPNLPAANRALDMLRKAEASGRGTMSGDGGPVAAAAAAQPMGPAAEASSFATATAVLLERARALRAHLLATVVDDEAMSEAHTTGSRPLTRDELIVDALEELLDSDLERVVTRLRSVGL